MAFKSDLGEKTSRSASPALVTDEEIETQREQVAQCDCDNQGIQDLENQGLGKAFPVIEQLLQSPEGRKPVHMGKAPGSSW